MVGRIVPLEVRPAETGVPVQGLQDKLRIYARIADEDCSKDVAYILAHPNVNYMHHYLIDPLQRRGRAAMGINTRYIGSDSMLLMERVIQDIGVGVKYLREQGYKRVVFIANSGGGAIGCLYQAQAEKLTITHTPDGRPIDLVQEDFPALDAIALSCVHLGRSHTLQSGLDPSVLDERDWLGTDPDLDMFNPKNGPPFDRDWLDAYRKAQKARHDRITDWVLARLREIDNMPKEAEIKDQPFIIHRTCARPQMLDPTLDPNDRPPGQAIWGSARASNYAPTILGRLSTLRSYLSQWSELSVADGPARLAETTCPVINIEFSADEGTYPSDVKQYSEAAGDRAEYYLLPGARHYPFLQENSEALIGELADVIVEWGDRH